MASFAEELADIAVRNFCRNAGAMYGSAARMAPGAGVFLHGVKHAIYNSVRGSFAAVRSTMLVLTHECDIEQKNNRQFNKHFIGVPLIYVDQIAREYEEKKKTSEAKTLITAVARGEVSRMYYLPPPSFDAPEFMYGALVYMNSIVSNHIDQIGTSKMGMSFALSQYGLEFADLMLKQHLFRPKSDHMADLGFAYRSVTITSAPKPKIIQG